MSAILYKILNGVVEQERVRPSDVSGLLELGYFSSPKEAEQFISFDSNGSGKLSNNEIKEAAKKAGIKIGKKTIATLKKELDIS